MKTLEIFLMSLGVIFLVYNLITFHLWRKEWCKQEKFPVKLATMVAGVILLAVVIFWMPLLSFFVAPLAMLVSFFIFELTRYNLSCSATAWGAVQPVKKLFFWQFFGYLIVTVWAIMVLNFFFVSVLLGGCCVIVYQLMIRTYDEEKKRFFKWQKFIEENSITL